MLAGLVNFIVFGLLPMGFAGAVAAVPARSRWARVAPVFLAIAGVAAVMLAFKEDPQGGDTTIWHGIIHVAAYFTWLLSLVVSYPFTWWRLRGGRLRKTARWPSALALLLFPPVLLLPNSGSAGNYLFFAVAMTPLAAIAIRMAVSERRVHPVSDDLAPRTRA